MYLNAIDTFRSYLLFFYFISPTQCFFLWNKESINSFIFLKEIHCLWLRYLESYIILEVSLSRMWIFVHPFFNFVCSFDTVFFILSMYFYRIVIFRLLFLECKFWLQFDRLMIVFWGLNIVQNLRKIDSTVYVTELSYFLSLLLFGCVLYLL